TTLATTAIHSAFHVTPAVSEAARGDTFAVTGSGFHPGETVRLELRLGGVVVQLGSAVADASGGFATTVTIPASAGVGSHTLHGVGLQSDRSFSSPLTVVQPAALAATGS